MVCAWETCSAGGPFGIAPQAEGFEGVKAALWGLPRVSGVFGLKIKSGLAVDS